MIEILTVLAIMSVLATFAVAGFQQLLGKNFSGQVSQLANILVRARAYAMANNTYVFVGIQEVNAATSPTVTPQTAGTGRIGVTVVASNDGTRGYLTSMASATSIPVAASFPTTQLNVIAPLVHFDNLHISNPGAGTFTGAPQQTYTYSISAAAANQGQSYTKFTWPIGAASPQYSFGGTATSATNQTSVIQFNPQGEAQIFTGANSDSNLEWIEIDLQPTHGNNVPASTTPQNAAIFIDGPSGNVSVFRT